jgi:hypothetical protein
MGPARDAILSTYLLEHGSTYAKLLRHIGDGQVEVLGELLAGNGDVRRRGGHEGGRTRWTRKGIGERI